MGLAWPPSSDDLATLSNPDLAIKYGVTRSKVTSWKQHHNVPTPKLTVAPSKVLLFDIEACDLSADNGYCFTFGYKWLGEPAARTMSLLDFPQKRRSDDTGLMKAVYKIISAADVIVSWYGKGYDIKYLNSRMIIAGLNVLPPVPHVDLYFTARFQLKLRSNRLASVQDFLQLEESKTKLDMRLWMVARDGEPKERKAALLYIDEHCRKDVLVLEQAYMKLRPLVRTHPNMGASNGGCRVCGSTDCQPDGKQIVNNRIKARIRCTNCSARRFA